jgi:hypothetical protein
MTPEEAHQEALRRIRKAEKTGALELDLSGFETLNRLPLEFSEAVAELVQWITVAETGVYRRRELFTFWCKKALV